MTNHRTINGVDDLAHIMVGSIALNTIINHTGAIIDITIDHIGLVRVKIIVKCNQSKDIHFLKHIVKDFLGFTF